MFLRLQRRRRSIRRRWLLLSALILLLTVPVLSAQDLARRLILKDGSYQLVTKYEVKGDRVRYLSAERDDWEELPASLVDWPATDKYERDRAAGQSVPEAAQLDKEIEKEQDRAQAMLPEVAPGLRLPADSGVFLLDSFQGEPQIVEVQQTAGDVSQKSKGGMLRGAITGVKQTIELEGAHAPVQSHVDVPALYINIDDAPQTAEQLAKDATTPASSPQQAQQPQSAQQPSVPFDRFRIVRTEVKGNKRILGDVKRQVTGKISEDQHPVKTTVTRVSGGWLKLTPTDNLAPGEYALVEMMAQEGMQGKEGMNLYVWDFGVNPKAAANANPWKPTPDSKLDPGSKPN
ncbi:MAG: hypothetical protein ACLPHP_22085 [Candidatus Sulfotelmatobacter sp.]